MFWIFRRLKELEDKLETIERESMNHKKYIEEQNEEKKYYKLRELFKKKKTILEKKVIIQDVRVNFRSKIENIKSYYIKSDNFIINYSSIEEVEKFYCSLSFPKEKNQ